MYICDCDDYLSAIVKPRHGNFGGGTRMMGRAALKRFYLDNPQFLDKQIVQPAYNFKRAFPKTIKPYDQASAESFADLNRAGNIKELRMYSFLSPTGTTTFPAARVLSPQVDDPAKVFSKWFFVDPESVPESLSDDTIKIMQRTARVTGSLAMFGAVDFGYGPAGTEPSEWRVIELNALSPGMISRQEHFAVANKLQTLFSQQIRVTVDSYAALAN